MVCAKINSSTGTVVTRGSASLQDVVLALKGLGLHANASECFSQRELSGKSTVGGSEGPDAVVDGRPLNVNTNTNGHKSSSMTQVPYPDLGYIADMKSVFSVKGMTCGACVASVERGLEKIPGVKSVSVALLTETAEVLYDGKLISWPGLIEAIEGIGYDGSHIYTSSSSSVEYSRRLFAVDMVRGSVNQSAFNCASVISHTLGLISLNWVDDGSSGHDDYEGGPVTSVAGSSAEGRLEETEDVENDRGTISHTARRYRSLARRQSFTGMAPELYNTVPVDTADMSQGAATTASHSSSVVPASYDRTKVSSSEVVLQSVFDSQLVGLRTIYETMCSLNPHFAVRLLPEKVALK